MQFIIILIAINYFLKAEDEKEYIITGSDDTVIDHSIRK